jgi:precorrin-6B methylase 2
MECDSVDIDEDASPYFWMEGDSLAPPCPSDDTVINCMLDLLAPYVSSNSEIWDLGCGDGRICIAVSRRFGCRSIGVEIEGNLVARFLRRIQRHAMEEKVQAMQGDLLECNLSNATAVVLYLLPEAITLVQERLVALLRKGGVVLCNSWGLKGLHPACVQDCGEGYNTRLLLYTKDSLPSPPNP